MSEICACSSSHCSALVEALLHVIRVGLAGDMQLPCGLTPVTDVGEFPLQIAQRSLEQPLDST
jgi:hypothetical protein